MSRNNKKIFIFLILLTGLGYLIGFSFRGDFNLIISNQTNRGIKNISMEFSNLDSEYNLEYLYPKSEHTINLKDYDPKNSLDYEEKLEILVHIDDQSYQIEEELDQDAKNFLVEFLEEDGKIEVRAGRR